MSTATGSNTIWAYYWEDDGEFAQEPADISDTDLKSFGLNEEIDDPEGSNNPERLSRPFNRQTQQMVATNFEGSWGTDFTMSNTWWLQYVFGKPVSTSEITDGGTGTGNFRHEYETQAANPPRSAQLIEEVHYPNGTIEQTVYIGAIVDSTDVDVSVEDTVEVSLGGLYADQRFFPDASNSPFGVIGSQPASEYRAMHFGQSDLFMDLDNDSTIERKALVQDASASFGLNAELENALGNRTPVIPSFLEIESTLDYTTLVRDNFAEEEKRAMYGSQSATQVQTKIDSQVAGELEFISEDEPNRMFLEFADTFPESFSRNNTGDPTAALEEDSSREVEQLTVTVETDESQPL